MGCQKVKNGSAFHEKVVREEGMRVWKSMKCDFSSLFLKFVKMSLVFAHHSVTFLLAT